MSGRRPPLPPKPKPQHELNGITEGDFQVWKHHPVSKVFFRYLMDFAEVLRQAQLQEIEQSDVAMDAKKQGEFKGRIATIREVASMEFTHIDAFYGHEEEEGSA